MTELNVSNMTCGGCAAAVSRAVKALEPAADVQVDLRAGRVQVAGRTPAADLIRVLGEAGFPATLASAAPRAATAPRKGCCCG